MRCEVLVYREYGPACCGAGAAHVQDAVPMCHPHFVAALNQHYPFRYYDAGEKERIEQRSRALFDRIMAVA